MFKTLNEHMKSIKFSCLVLMTKFCIKNSGYDGLAPGNQIRVN